MTDHASKFESMIRLWGAILCHVEKLAVAYRIGTNLYIWTSDGSDPTADHVRPDRAFPIQHVDTETFKRDFEVYGANWTVYALTKANYPEEYRNHLLSNIWPSSPSNFPGTKIYSTPSMAIYEVKRSWFNGINCIKQEGVLPEAKTIRLFPEVGKTYDEVYSANALIANNNWSVMDPIPDNLLQIDQILPDHQQLDVKTTPMLRPTWMARAFVELLPTWLYQRITPIDYAQRNIGMGNRTLYGVNQGVVAFPYGHDSAVRFYNLELDMLCRGAARGKKLALLRNVIVPTGKYCTNTDDYIEVSVNITIPTDDFREAVNGIVYSKEPTAITLKTTEYVDGNIGSMKFANMPEAQLVSRQKLLELHNDDPLGDLLQITGSTEPRKQLTLE